VHSVLKGDGEEDTRADRPASVAASSTRGVESKGVRPPENGKAETETIERENKFANVGEVGNDSLNDIEKFDERDYSVASGEGVIVDPEDENKPSGILGRFFKETTKVTSEKVGGLGKNAEGNAVSLKVCAMNDGFYLSLT
jgi:hypothetical protein